MTDDTITKLNVAARAAMVELAEAVAALEQGDDVVEAVEAIKRAKLHADAAQRFAQERYEQVKQQRPRNMGEVAAELTAKEQQSDD